MDNNVFAKSDGIPSLPVPVIKEKPKCRGLRLTKGNNSKTLKKLVPSPDFSIINVHLVDINVSAKFYEIQSLAFQDIEKPKQTDNVKTVYPPPTSTNTVCRGYNK